MSENTLWAVFWSCVTIVVLSILAGAYSYNFRIIALKSKALEHGATVAQLQCVDPSSTQIAACVLLAAQK